MARIARTPIVLAAFVLFAARPTHAWNPLKPIAAAAKRAGRAIGGVAGGFVESAAAPTIRNAEASGRRLIVDVEGSLGRQIDHAGGVASKLVGEVDKSLGDKLEKVDRSLEARIVQVNVTADEIVDRAFGRLDQSIGRIDAVARKRIEQLGKLGKDLIKQADDAAVKLLAQIDAILERRTADLGRLVSSSLQQADAAAAARIDQVDDVAGRRIGSIDVIATKQSLGIEVMLLRLAALVGMVVFLAFVLWRLFVEASNAWKKALEEESPHRVWTTLANGAPRFFIQLAFGVAGIAALYLLSGYLPRDAKARTEQQIAEHEKALSSAFEAYDFTNVRYHSTQLEVLKTEEAPRYRALARKAELLRMVLGRPALLQSIAGVREVAAETTAVEAALGAPDPDILTLQAFVTWRVGVTRRDEYEAAVLCAQALQLEPSMSGRFMLAVLARNYLRAFLYDPYPVDDEVTAADLAKLRTALPATVESKESLQFQHLVEYNALVATLDTKSTAAYLDMLDAHVEYELARGSRTVAEPAAARDARERRRQHAERVVDAWRVFDGELASSPWLADDPTALAAFTLDDAVLSRALYFTVVPEATELPPALVAGSAKVPALVRVKTAPIRVAWAKRYATLVGPRAGEVLAIEETQRFASFERRAMDFEHAYVAFEVARRRTPRADTMQLTTAATTAIRAASDIGFYRGASPSRRSMATILVESLREAGGEVDADVVSYLRDGHQRRRLRFL